ncbi:hypothetical protein DW1_0303 [Proteiniborus sp. DW1]|uniref:CDP-glycerol glycerophosphotransferase family protein n=1 Tax=Proteiniborus sp. DW1 TaxID=1889883 RepID=UPI00092E09BB|nr:CDP-glycerol glycerophosphotransferase family protein [Proteiniborus sp. DW1]SCG81923.1 hypothetical protein DW1_0303 [Proteiniborus sp. DW1]
MEKMFNKKLELFIDKYEYMKKFFYFSKNGINEYLLSKIDLNDKVAIWGAGEHTEKLLQLINIENINILCCVDKSKEKRGLYIEGIRIVQPCEIKDYKIDTIIISSYSFRKEIREEINKLSSMYKIVDFYDKYDLGFPFFYKYLNANTMLIAITVISIFNDIKAMGYKVDKENEKKVIEIIAQNNFDIEDIKRKNGVLNRNLLHKHEDNYDEGSKIKVDFFFQYPQGWTSLETVWKSFNEDNRFIARLIQVPFLQEFKDIFSDDSRKFLLDSNIPFIPWYLYDIDEEKPDIVFYQSPYDELRPKEFSSREIYRKTRIAYIPYALEIGGGDLNYRLQFNLFLHNNAWMIFARSKRHKEMYRKYSSNKGKNVVVTGHPKIDAIYKLKDFNVDREMAKMVKGRKVFIWNPHFSIGSDPLSNWSTFNIWKDIILDIFEKRQNCFLIIRPHPLLLERLDKECEESIPKVKEFKDRISKMGNVYIDRNFDYRHSFAISDALLSDASSFLLEYLATYKPIMYLPNKNGPSLNEDGDIVEYYYKAYERKDIEEYVDMVANGFDTMKDIRTSKIEEYLGIVDGKVGERIKNCVLEKYDFENVSI